ncbi:hypothetical protein [Pararhizobium sp. DWP1-1-3]|uniref:hypothetical protein n=1 Tax=Pararhizobium sp. DWP1-1-3 TaxID=2804652 RepID=UPI003CEB10B1
MRIAIIGVAVIGLVGCETKLPSEMSYTEIKQLAQKLIQRCIDQGATPNSAEMDACLHQEKQRELTTRYDNRAALRDVGNGLQKAADNYNRNATQNRPVTCTSTPMGPTIRTTCY